MPPRKIAPRGQTITPTPRCPITIVPASHQRSTAPPVVWLSDSDTQEALSRTQSPRRYPRAMSTPQPTSKTSSATLQGSSTNLVPQTPSTLMHSSLPLDSPLGNLKASNTSVATLHAADTAASTLRSRYTAQTIPDNSAGPSSSPGPEATDLAKPGPSTSESLVQAKPAQPTVQDDVESQTSSSPSAGASGRHRKALARYDSPIRHSVKEVEESVATSPSTGQFGGSSPVTAKRRFIRRNTEGFVQSCSSTSRHSPKEIVFKE